MTYGEAVSQPENSEPAARPPRRRLRLTTGGRR